jgi:hypothetical protein
MKRFLPCIIFILLLISSFSFGAGDKGTARELTNCGSSKELNAFLEKTEEELVFNGSMQRIVNGKTISALMIVTMSKTGNWTVFEYFNKEVVCITDVGSKGELRFPTLNAI